MNTGIGKVKPFGLRLPPELKSWVEEQARQDRRSVNSWLTLLIEEKRNAQHEKQA